MNNVKMMSLTSQPGLLNKQKIHLMAKNHLISYFKDTFCLHLDDAVGQVTSGFVLNVSEYCYRSH